MKKILPIAIYSCSLIITTVSYFSYSFTKNSPKTEDEIQLNNVHGNAGCLIVRHDGSILMARFRKSNKLHMPGGTAKAGENVLDTAKREVFEEVGLVPTINELVKKYDNNFYLFSCNVEGRISPSHSFEDEISGLEWVQPIKMKDAELRFPREYKNLHIKILSDIKEGKFKNFND